MKDNNKIFFPNLDPLRFLAAFMIVIAHGFEGYNGWFGKNKILLAENQVDYNLFGYYLDRFLSNLNIGVDVFFLISGFLITYILIKEKEKIGNISLRKFYFRRILRIWPLYFFLVALSPFLVSWTKSTPSPDYLSTLLFYNNFHTISTQTWTFPFSHFWSICIEEHFYVFWPLIIAFIPKKNLIPVFLYIILISILSKFYVVTFLENQWHHLYLNTLCRIDVMVIGAILAYFYYKKPFVLSVPISVRIFTYFLLIGILVLDGYNDYSTFISAIFKKYIYVSLFGFAFLIYNFNDKAFLRFRANSFIHYLGKTSYGIYMYGNILLLIVIKRIMLNNNMNNPYVFWIILIALSIIIPIISYEIIEKPFLKLKDKFSNISTKH